MQSNNTMGRATISVKKKLEILNYFQQSQNIKHTARHFSTRDTTYQPSQIRKWLREKTKLELKAKSNPKALSLHEGRNVENESLEMDVFDWILAQRQAEISVSTAGIIAKALSLDSNFKGKEDNTLRSWVYRFLARWNLSCRMTTHVGQKLHGHLIEVKQNFVAVLKKKFSNIGCYSTVPSSMFVNMDETAIFFEARSKSTVHRTGARTVSARESGSNSRRLTACVSVACDGTKLPLFLIFKGKPNGRIEQQLTNLLPENMFGGCQDKGRMDTRSMKIWTEKVWLLYVSGYGQSVLLLDDFSCHKAPALIDCLKEVGTSVELIPGGYTCVLQP